MPLQVLRIENAVNHPDICRAIFTDGSVVYSNNDMGVCVQANGDALTPEQATLLDELYSDSMPLEQDGEFTLTPELKQSLGEDLSLD